MSYLMNEYAIYSFGCVLLPCLICQLVMVIRAGDLGIMRIFTFSVDLCIYGLYLDGIPGDRTWDTR